MPLLKPRCGVVLLAFVGLLLGPVHEAFGQCQRGKLGADDGAPDDWFGYAVGISGEVGVVGANHHDHLGYNYGAAYIFERSAGTWSQVAEIAPDDGGGFVGWAVGIDGDFVVLGAKTAWTSVFQRDPNGGWSQVGQLEPNDYTSGSLFGQAVGISGDSIVVGAPHDDDNGWRSGSAYVFDRDPNGVWSQVTKFLAHDGEAYDKFGYAVALCDGVAVIGAPGDNDQGNYSGSAYVFERDLNGAWWQAAKLLASDGGPFTGFAYNLATSDSVAIIGASDAHGNQDHTGAAYVYERDPNGAWPEVAKLIADDGETGDGLGSAAAISGDIAVIGAAGDYGPGGKSGSAYVFVRQPDGGWLQVGRLVADDGAPSDWFGGSVGLSGNTAVIGAYGDDDQGEDSGSAYIFAVGPDEDGNGIMDVCELPGTPTQAPKGRQGLGTGRQAQASKVLP